MKIALNKYQFLTLSGLFWIGLEILGIILAIAGIFYKEIIFGYLFFGLIVFSFFLFSSKIIISRHLKFLPAVLISVFFIVALFFYTPPTIFSGRDQGSFSQAAIMLSQNHTLTFSSPASEEFFEIYGPGRALNFPGFDYTREGKLITNFALGYTVWLAVFYSIFGLTGLVIANGVTLFIFLFCFFLIARLYLRPANAVWAWILALTSFSFSWFFKFTLSENLALALSWFGILEFLLFLKKEEKLYLLASLFSFLVLAFTRIEAWAFIAMIFVALYIKYRKVDIIKEKLSDYRLLAAMAAIILLFIISLWVNFPFYRTFIKGFLGAFLPAKNEADIPSYSPHFLLYLFKVLGIYAILNYLILFLFGVIFFLKNKKYEILAVAFISLPILIYLINPSISSDHPWMLRRYVFVVLPAAILYSVIFLEKFFRKKIVGYAVLLMLFATNLAVFLIYFPVSENKNLLSQTAQISQNFNSRDLVLIDREAAGSGWNMISGPMSFLYGKQAVYFFNPSDIAKIHADRFSGLYIIIPDKNLDFYRKSELGNRLALIKDYQIETTLLDIQTGKKSDLYNEPVKFPELNDVIIHGGIYQIK